MPNIQQLCFLVIECKLSIQSLPISNNPKLNTKNTWYIKIFSGFKSLCITSYLCMYLKPSQTCRRYLETWFYGIFRFFFNCPIDPSGKIYNIRYKYSSSSKNPYKVVKCLCCRKDWILIYLKMLSSSLSSFIFFFDTFFNTHKNPTNLYCAM